MYIYIYIYCRSKLYLYDRIVSAIEYSPDNIALKKRSRAKKGM